MTFFAKIHYNEKEIIFWLKTLLSYDMAHIISKLKIQITILISRSCEINFRKFSKKRFTNPFRRCGSKLSNFYLFHSDWLISHSLHHHHEHQRIWCRIRIVFHQKKRQHWWKLAISIDVAIWIFIFNYIKTIFREVLF